MRAGIGALIARRKKMQQAVWVGTCLRLGGAAGVRTLDLITAGVQTGTLVRTGV